MKFRRHLTPDVHLNLNVRGLPQSATLAINEQSIRLRWEGRQVFRLGLGQSPFPVPHPVVESLKANAAQKDYLNEGKQKHYLKSDKMGGHFGMYPLMLGRYHKYRSRRSER